MSILNIRKDCRLCRSKELNLVLQLEDSPPANEFVTKSEINEIQDKFPLQLWECQKCGHIQLPVVVDPNRLFRNYVYVAGTSPVFVNHFKQYAATMIDKLRMQPGDLVVDIGSNDGTLLRCFKEAGMKVLGVDPARKIAEEATLSGIQTIPEFFTQKLAREIRRTYGHAKLITANNVFAHADDLGDIVLGVQYLLEDSGAFIFEVQYLVDLVEKTLFDMIYHEHTSYHHLAPLLKFLSDYGMYIFDAERISTHGGSLRVYSALNEDRLYFENRDQIRDLIEYENQIGLLVSGKQRDISAIENLRIKIDNLKEQLVSKLGSIRADGKRIAGFGAPAKVTTLMHQFKLESTILDFIVDDSPLKQGLYTPGKFIPVVPSSVLYEKMPEYCLILAWNFADSIIKNHQKYLEQGGRFIVPIPELKVIE